MKTITIYLAVIMLSLNVQIGYTQDSIVVKPNSEKIENLIQLKAQIKKEEKDQLKTEVEQVNQRLEKGEITKEEAEKLKKEFAEKRALNIKNRVAIIDNKIALLERNEAVSTQSDSSDYVIRIGGSDNDETNEEFIYIGKRDRDKPKKYDRRTRSDLVFAIGFNNAIIEGENIDDSPYKLGGSGFVELGWAWKTRVFNNSNALRLKYGFSFMWNKLDIKDNKYLVEIDGNIVLEDFPTNLNKAKFRMTNLVFPVHFEFGPSKKIERDNYFRYSTDDKFKIGLGGFAGFNLQTLQKLKYKEDGRRVKDKIKNGYNTTDFVYGLSGYIAFDDVALYVKYDLSPIFKHQLIDQNNISVGLRFDMD
ncbi:MAG: hypothetical protein HKO92_03135 [Flavobacteriaceae bacterium]|nr:hypothetical protein [Flavobacteriaceae bacterium]